MFQIDEFGVVELAVDLLQKAEFLIANPNQRPKHWEIGRAANRDFRLTMVLVVTIRDQQAQHRNFRDRGIDLDRGLLPMMEQARKQTGLVLEVLLMSWVMAEIVILEIGRAHV